MILKNELKNLSEGRLKHLGIRAKILEEDIYSKLSRDNCTMFEIFYIISLALLYLMKTFGNEALGYFTEIFNEMCLINQHKEN
jgi:hypothetical protein